MTAQVRDAKTIATNQTRAKDGEPLRCLRRTTEINANQKSHDLLWSMAFVCGFIVTVYARFSINNLSSAAKNNPSARVCSNGVKHAHC